jgi:poly-beta-1,6-N-acetyl-D-glucosamine synthase
MRRELAVPIPADSLLDDVYLPLAAFFRGYRLIMEEQARAFDHPTSVKTEFGRKVRTLAGNYQILKHHPGLLSFRNRMLFHYLSYKFARLMLPWMFLLLLVSSFGLPSPWRELVLGAQGFFYLLAGLDFLVSADSVLRRISSPARTVVSMLAAAACAVAVFFVPPQRLWKPTRVRLAEKD